MKKRLFIIALVIFVIVSMHSFLEFRYKTLYGNKYQVSNPTMIYWYPEDSVENVSYYLFKKGDILYCDYESVKKDFYLCAWKFNIVRDPLFGWVKSKNLEKR